MRVYKVIVQVLDFENSSDEDIIGGVENNKNYNIQVKNIKSVDIPNWDDNHPLNKSDTAVSAFNSLFPN